MMTISRTWSQFMTKRKKKYFPNNWKPIKDAPEEAFEPIGFDEFMDWKIGGYEIPDEIACIIREQNINTGKVKEYVYQYRHAAKKKARKLIMQDDTEVTIVQRDSVHFIPPKYYDDII